jgi:hypothetical protein
MYMGEVSRGNETIPASERIRNALWAIELLTHDNLNQHNNAERVVFTYQDDTQGVYHSGELTRVPALEGETVSYYPTLILRDGPREMAYTWMNDDEVLYYAPGRLDPEQSTPDNVAGMADGLEWLQYNMRNHPELCSLEVEPTWSDAR